MIKETIDKNSHIKPNSRGLEILKQSLPQCFDKDGKFVLNLFEQYIKEEEIDVKREGYALNFLGKSYARYLSGLDSETVIVPDGKNDNEKTQNVYVVGDNLDALQHLKYSYSGQIKCIYIDPLYNTGSDGFVYKDKFEFTVEELSLIIGIGEDEAQRILDMQGTATHSAWLTFMYPRLELAKSLLTNDGIIFISIDDNEQANCKLLCDAVFGEGNFIANLVWKSKSGGANDSKFVAVDHEYVLAYCRNINEFSTKLVNYNSDLEALYSGKDEFFEERGPYRPMLLQQKGLSFSKSLTYEITAPDGSVLTPEKGGAIWRWSKQKFLDAKERGFIEFKKVKDEYKVYTKQYLYVDYEGNKIERGRLLRSVIDDIDGRSGTRNLQKLFGFKVFTNSKPYELIKLLLQICTDEDDLVLDFFSGSGTTAEAVMELNAEDGGNRKFIMVQLPEECSDKSEAKANGYKYISDIGRARIEKAGIRLKAENPGKSGYTDFDFNTYYLEQPDKNTLDKLIEFTPHISTDGLDVKNKFGYKSVLATWKMRDGYGFNTQTEEIDLCGYTAYLATNSNVGSTLYLLENMPDAAIKELISKLESFELCADRIIEYGFAFGYAANTSLFTNLKSLKNRRPIEPIVRY